MASRAPKVVLPASSAQASDVGIQSGGSEMIRPSRPMITRVGSCSSRHQVTSVRSPNVQHMTKPGSQLALDELVREHRQLHPEHRAGHRLADQIGVPLIVRVRDQRHAGRDEFGTGGFDVDRARRRVERHPVEVARVVPRLQLGLSHCRLERHVPHGGGLGQVRLAPPEVAEEAQLGDLDRVVADRRVQVIPVHAQPDPPPQVLEGLLVDVGQLVAELDEVSPADRHLALGVRADSAG